MKIKSRAGERGLENPGKRIHISALNVMVEAGVPVKVFRFKT